MLTGINIFMAIIGWIVMGGSACWAVHLIFRSDRKIEELEKRMQQLENENMRIILESSYMTDDKTLYADGRPLAGFREGKSRV